MNTPHLQETPLSVLRFPAGFLWGAATASYQIEGAVDADGRGPSIWDTFTAIPGKITGGDTGRNACDHYLRFESDVALMAGLGLGAYRFSIAWPRVQPGGHRVEPRGLGFYDRLVDRLLQHGITPMITLYHWDLPQHIADNGGWLARDTASRFVDYAEAVHKTLGDRVTQWTTINEPFCAAYLGYGTGLHAPGDTDHAAAFRAAHHLLLAHGLATEALRSPGDDQQLSIVLNLSPAVGEDGDATRRFDGIHNRFFLDPLTRGEYPADVLEDIAYLGALEPVLCDGDLTTIAAPIDWLGVNYYAPTRVVGLADRTTPSNCGLPGLRGVDVAPIHGEPTGMGWEQHPESLTDLLVRLRDDCPGLPLVITENGAAFPDEPSEDGRVADPARAAYIDAHLRAVHAAIAQGVDVRGYLVWSLLDNFEWSLGYSQRFGIVRVDFDTQRRTVKDSGRYLAEVMAANALPEETHRPSG